MTATPGIPAAKRIIVLSAPSGTGKTTLCERLLKAIPDLELSISLTTRAPRGMEKDGIHYHFVSRDQFQSEIDQGLFVEWAQVHGNYYGTSKRVIDATLAKGKCALLDIDVQGAESFRKAYPELALTVFVSPPSLEILEKRLRARKTDSEETIQKRLKNARDEMIEAPRFHEQLVNDDLEQTADELIELVSDAIHPKPKSDLAGLR